MRITRQVTPLVVGASLAIGSVGLTAGAATAQAPEDGVSVTQEAQSKQVEATYSTRDVVAFFVLGTGRIYDDHPEIAEAMSIPRQEVDDTVIDAITNEFESADPNFETAVTEAVQSGDPERAQDGLDRLVEDAKKVREAIESDQASFDGASNADTASAAAAQGWTYQTNWVATTNAAVGEVAGVVVVAAAAVGVAVVLYSPDDSASAYEKDLLAKTVSEGLGQN